MAVNLFANRERKNPVPSLLCIATKGCDNIEYGIIGKYYIYENGEVYSNISHKFLKPDISRGYKQVTLFIDGKKVRKKVHRLVAELFLENPFDYSMINHKDGNKLNNHYTNLEWCTCYYNNKHARETGLNNISKSNSERWKNELFRNRVSKNISNAIKESGSSKGNRNPRFRYEILYDGSLISRIELSSLLHKSQSYTDSLIAKAANGESVHLFNLLKITVYDTKQKGQSTIESIA